MPHISENTKQIIIYVLMTVLVICAYNSTIDTIKLKIKTTQLIHTLLKAIKIVYNFKNEEKV